MREEMIVDRRSTSFRTLDGAVVEMNDDGSVTSRVSHCIVRVAGVFARRSGSKSERS
jgi:hypothetical protein